jgi:hypothetical protein
VAERDVTSAFRDGYKWRFSDGGEKPFTGDVEDAAVLNEVTEGKVSLAANDTLRCLIREEQTWMVRCCGRTLRWCGCSSTSPVRASCACSDLSVGSEESFAVEMDQVRGRVSDPHLGLPGDLAQVPSHGLSARERRHVNEAGSGILEEPRQLTMPLAVHRPVTGDGFHQPQPIAHRIEQQNVRHFAVAIGGGARLGEQRGVEVSPLFSSVAGVDQNAAWCELRR